MKRLRDIICEGHYWRTSDNSGGSLDKDVSRHYWKMRHAIENKYGQFKKIYEDSLRQQFIDFLNDCGTNDKWHAVYINPIPIEFDYKLSAKHNKGLVCGFYMDPNDNEPLIMVDCLDGKPVFALIMDELMTGRLLRLRNNVLIDDSVLYKIITNGYIAYTIPKEYSKELRKKEYDRVTSDYGIIADDLRKLFKEKDYDEFEKTIKSIVENHGSQNSYGKYMDLKRVGRFWNCFINQISVNKNDVWITVYMQGDLSDDEQNIKLSDLLRRKKMVLTYKNESFIVDSENITDMIDDIEDYLKKNK